MVSFHPDESLKGHAQTAEEWLFENLDHRRVGDGDDGWVVCVVGVHVDGDTIWVQVAKDDRDDDTIVVRMERGTKVADVVASLKHADSISARVIAVPRFGIESR